MNKDLTVGKPQKVLWQFCLPLFGSIVFQQLYNIADSFVAGKFINNDALAAVGNSYEITLIFIAFAFGSNIGCSVVASRLFGAKRYQELKTAVSTTLLTGVVLCAVLMLFGILFCGTLLRMIHTPEEIFADSALYLTIYVWGFPFVFFYHIATGIFSALGDSRTPFLFLAVSSIANILVDMLFVVSFSMGVAGVAWATFLCQGISCLLAVFVVFRRLRRIPTQGRAPIFSRRLLGEVALVAVPSILQQSFVSVGNIVIQRVVNGFGSGVIAGFAAATKLNNLVITSLTTVANGISNFTAQNLGAGKTERIFQGFFAGIRLVFLIGIPLSVLYLTAGEWFVGLFLEEPTGEAMETGIRFLRIVAPFYAVISMKLVADAVLRGTGRMGLFMTTTFTDLMLRVILASILAKTALQTVGIWISWPICWCLATLMSLLFYRFGVQKRLSQSAEESVV